jgi:hypothetical protein
MSDPQASNREAPIGDPIVEPSPTDDVVGRAHGSLADAEAAREAVPADATHHGEPVTAVPAEPVDDSTKEYATNTSSTQADDTDETPWYDRPEHLQPAGATTPETDDAVRTETVPRDTERAGAALAAAPVAASAGTAYGEPAYVSQTPQPIFVQAPEAPLPRGNRGAAGAIGLLAALAFAILLLLAWIGFGLIRGDVPAEGLVDATLAVISTWAFWVPVVVFFLAFWLLGAVINRGRWGHWVIWGLLVGVASYLGYILGQLIQAPFWMLSASQGADLIEENLLAPLAIASFVIGRELTIWFGAWVAARGKRVTELNIESQREYERTLEAGPKLVQQ